VPHASMGTHMLARKMLPYTLEVPARPNGVGVWATGELLESDPCPTS
jgi:hypothetical protein